MQILPIQIREKDGKTKCSIYHIPLRGKRTPIYTNRNCYDKKWWKAAGIRAVKTVAQTAVATIGATAMVSEDNWLVVGSTALLSGVPDFSGGLKSFTPQLLTEQY